MNTVSQTLRQARALISEPGTNIKFVSKQYMRGKVGYCATGALWEVTDEGRNRAKYWGAVAALAAVLKLHYHAGTLPAPTHAGGGAPPIPWSNIFMFTSMFNSYLNQAEAVAQFNNSTDQARVLALFDEAIADAEGDEGTPTQPEPEKPAEPEAPPTPPVREPERAPAARVRVLEPA